MAMKALTTLHTSLPEESARLAIPSAARSGPQRLPVHPRSETLLLVSSGGSFACTLPGGASAKGQPGPLSVHCRQAGAHHGRTPSAHGDGEFMFPALGHGRCGAVERRTAKCGLSSEIVCDHW